MQFAEHNSADYTAPRMAQAPAAAVASSKTEGLSFAGCAGVLRPVRGGPKPSFSLIEVLLWLGVPKQNWCSMRRSAMTKGGAEVVDDIHIDGTHVMRLIAAHGRGAAIEAICRLMSTPPAVPAPGLVPATSEIAAAPEVPPVPAALGPAAVPKAAHSLDDGNDAAREDDASGHCEAARIGAVECACGVGTNRDEGSTGGRGGKAGKAASIINLHIEKLESAKTIGGCRIEEEAAAADALKWREAFDCTVEGGGRLVARSEDCVHRVRVEKDSVSVEGRVRRDCGRIAIGVTVRVEGIAAACRMARARTPLLHVSCIS